MYNMIELAKSTGKAILISGDEGCGKSTLARNLTRGKFVEVKMESIDDIFCTWMDDKPDVVIIDGAMKPKHIDTIKQLIANETMEIHQKGKNSVIVKVPTFIFTCPFIPVDVRGRGNRRFLFIEMGR